MASPDLPGENLGSPFENNQKSSSDEIYGEEYYRTSCGRYPYERNAHWIEFFGGIAGRIVETLKPGSVFDAGCALGFLVESLRDRGVAADV